jgi:predicted P-loop ATPase
MISQKSKINNSQVANLKNAASDILEASKIQAISDRYSAIKFQLYPLTDSRKQPKEEIRKQCNIWRARASDDKSKWDGGKRFEFPAFEGITSLINTLTHGISVHFGITEKSTRAEDFLYADTGYIDYDAFDKEGKLIEAAATMDELVNLPTIKRYCAFYQHSYKGYPNTHFHGVYDRSATRVEHEKVMAYWNYLVNQELGQDKKSFDSSTENNSSHVCYAGKTPCQFIERIPGLDNDYGDLIPVDEWVKKCDELGLWEDSKAPLPEKKPPTESSKESPLEYIQRAGVQEKLEGDFTALYSLFYPEANWKSPQQMPDGSLKVKGSNPFSLTNHSGESLYITKYDNNLPPVWTSACGVEGESKKGGDITDFVYILGRIKGEFQKGGVKGNYKKIIDTITTEIGIPRYEWRKKSDDDDKTKRQVLIEAILDVYEPEIIRFNEMTQKPEINGIPVGFDTIAVEFDRDYSIVMTKDRAREIILTLAKDNSYHPVRDYLNYVADSHPPTPELQARLSSLSTRYFGTVEPIYDVYVRKQLVGAVARIFEPGCHLKTITVLQGKQDAGKSQWIKYLAGKEWFNDNLDPSKGSDKDTKQMVNSYWHHEIGEIDQFFRKSDRASVKSFLSSPSDNFRAPYSADTVSHHRTSVFWGSTNETDILSDPTGSVRFWCIPVATDAVDFESIISERDMLWAAAVHSYRAGEKWWLTKDEEKQRDEANEQFNSSDPWEMLIIPHVSQYSAVPVQLIYPLLGIEKKDQNKANQNRICDILKKNGWVYDAKNKKILGSQYRLWINSDKSTDLKDPKEAVSQMMKDFSIPYHLDSGCDALKDF